MSQSIDTRDVTDPYLLRMDGHSVSGSGIYCPNEEQEYDPPSGMERGDPCPLCGEVFG